MIKSKVSLSLKGLEEFQEQLSRYKTRVGILGGDTNRKDANGITNSEIGVVQMFGSVANNIPPRDFLVTPIEMHKKDLTKAIQRGKMKQFMNAGQFKKVFNDLGLHASNIVRQAFDTSGFGQWAPNKPSTIAKKGSSKPLINIGYLRSSISHDVVNASEVE